MPATSQIPRGQEWLSCAQAAKILGVSREYVRNQVYRGEYGEYFFSRGLGIRINADRFRAWIASQRVPVNHQSPSQLEARRA